MFYKKETKMLEIIVHYERPEDYSDTLEETLDLIDRYKEQGIIEVGYRLIMDGTRSRIVRISRKTDKS